VSETRDELAAQYRRALEDYLDGAGETALARAYELGRKAVADGLGVLEMAALHHEALRASVRRLAAVEDRAKATEAAHGFLIESLSPFEMTHRAFREATAVLRRLHERLEEEAKRIAHSLHDEAAQLLASWRWPRCPAICPRPPGAVSRRSGGCSTGSKTTCGACRTSCARRCSTTSASCPHFGSWRKG